MRGGELSKPGGHYTEMTQYQRGLKNDITEYKRDCVGKDRCDGKGSWEPIGRSVDEMSNRPIVPPIFPPAESSSNSSTGAWVAGGALVIVIGACAIAEPCGAIALGVLGLGGSTILVTQ